MAFSAATIPSNSDLTYFKNHLLATQFRGDVYQISHFTRFCLFHLFNERRTFQAEIESQGYGNLDDIQITLNGRVKAYQVKFYKDPIQLQDFWNKDKSAAKNAKMHIGKFFDGWLSLQGKGGGEVAPYLLTNTSLDPEFNAFLEVTKDKNRKLPQLKFEESFINESKRIQLKDVPPKKVYKNFLEEKGVATERLSRKIWNALQKKGFFDNEQHPTQSVVEYANRPNFGLSNREFLELKGGAYGSLKLSQVVEKLQSIKESYELHQIENNRVDIGLLQHLFKEACAYLERKNRHPSFRKEQEGVRKEEFRRFLRAFRFNVNRESLEELHGRIQDLIESKYPTYSSSLYPYIYFEIHAWFTQPREFFKNTGEKTPIIDNAWMKNLIEQSITYTKIIFSLQGESTAALRTLSSECFVHRIELERLKRAFEKQEGTILVVGEKGIGKSRLVKEALTQGFFSPQYLFLSGKDLIEDQQLLNNLYSVLEKVSWLRIIVIDGAEVFLQQDTPYQNLNQLLTYLSEKWKRTLVLTFTPEVQEYASSLLGSDTTIIQLDPLSKEEIIKTFPQLRAYQHVEPLIKLAQVPFYLSAIIQLFGQKESEGQLQHLIKRQNAYLEGKLVKWMIQGHDSKLASEKKMLCQQLAIELSKSRKLGVELEETPSLNSLIEDKIIIKKGKYYFFSHDLFFEYNIMSFWLQKWEICYKEQKTRAFWKKLNSFLNFYGSSFVLEKWFLLHETQLTKDLLSLQDIIPQLSYAPSLITAKNINILFPLFLKELEKLANPKPMIFECEGKEDIYDIYELRDEKTISYCESLLKTMSIIINKYHAYLTTDTLAAIAESLISAWHQEAQRGRLPLGQRLINPEILGDILLTLATYFANDHFTHLLIEGVIDQGDPQDEDKASILPLTKAAVEALLKCSSQKNLQLLLEFVIEDVEDYLTSKSEALRESRQRRYAVIPEWRYNVIWIIGEVARRQPAFIQTEDRIVDFINALKTILKAEKRWQHALYAAEALGKMGTMLDQNQISQVIQILEEGLLGKHNIVGIDMVQAGAAWALGEIGIKRAEVANEIFDILVRRCVEPDEDVRHAIVEALKNLSKVNNFEQIDKIFPILLGFLLDKDAKVRKTAIKTLEEVIKKRGDYIIAHFEIFIEAAEKSLSNENIPRTRTHVGKWDSARAALIWILYDLALILPTSDEKYQCLVRIIKKYARDNSENVKEAAREVLNSITPLNDPHS